VKKRLSVDSEGGTGSSREGRGGIKLVRLGEVALVKNLGNDCCGHGGGSRILWRSKAKQSLEAALGRR